MPRGRAALFLVLYICGVLYITLYPWDIVSPPHAPGLFWVSSYSRRIVLDFALNILLYIPLGAAAFAALRSNAYGFAAAVMLGFAISLGVELTQRYIPFRAATFDDLVANTLGASLGGIIASSSKKKLSDAGILAILWLLWNGFLLLPMINHAPLPAIGLDADLLWIGTISTLLGFLALSLAIKPNAIPGAILALAPAAVLWMHPTLLFSRLAATIGAVLIARFARPQLTRVFAPACLIWLVFQELYPFDFGRPIHAFSWIPFETLFENRPQNYYPAIFEKLFLYTAVVWAMRLQGAKLFNAYSVPAVALMAGEFGQCFLPGRTPELTDLVLISVGAFMLGLTESPESCFRGQTPAGVGYQIRGTEK